MGKKKPKSKTVSNENASQETIVKNHSWISIKFIMDK